MHSIKSQSDRARLWSRLIARTSGALAAAGIVVLLAGCGGRSSPGVAHASGPAASTDGAPASVSGPRSAVAYAACMRSHGVAAFPDPGSDGRFSLGGSIDPSSPRFQTAQRVCQSLLPTGGASLATQAGSGSVSPQTQRQLLRFARCMRAHGVPNFPDPTSQGIALSPAIDPKSSQFAAATQACRKLAPALGQNGAQTTAAGSGGGS